MRKLLAIIVALAGIIGLSLIVSNNPVEEQEQPEKLVFGQASRFSDETTHVKLDIDSDIPQGERVEIAKDEARFTLKGWNDEYAITITPQIPNPSLGAVGERNFKMPVRLAENADRLEYKSGAVTAFIEPRAGSGNEFDIDFELASKPATNVFEYKIEGAEEFDFFYQPALTPEEIAEGAERPENVIGSYAVYHKTKANHRLGSTNYATGKAYHIYRPKAIDALGTEQWSELSYVNGILTVTVPQEFLDTATYPVKVDPTFGYTSIGGTSQLSAGAEIYGATISENGDVTKMSFYGKDSGDTFKTAIYDDGSNDPENLISESSDAPSLGSSAAWVDATISASLTGSTLYWLGVGFNNTSTYYYDAGGTTFWTNSWSSWGDPWTSTATHSRTVSIYATYCPADFPCVEGREITGTSSAGTVHTLAVPAGTVADDLLVAFFSSDGNVTITWETGWTEMFEVQADVSHKFSGAYIKATSSDDVTVTTSGTEHTVGVVYRITGAEDPATQAPESNTATGASGSPDPPSLTPTGGAKNYLWFAVEGNDDNNDTATAFPTNYEQTFTQGSSGGGFGAAIAGGLRYLNATSEDPGAFTIAAEAWGAATVAVHPVAVATPESERNTPSIIWIESH